MKILIPMAGNGQRFVDAGYTEPKPFIDVLGKTMIERVIENLGGPSVGQYIFVVRDHKAMDRIITFMPDCTAIVVNGETAGAACTALLAAQFINNSEPLLIVNSDQIIDGPCDEIIERLPPSSRGAIWTFDSTHPKWSYAAVDRYGRVWGVAEKQVISRRATCGIYWYRHGRDFVRCAQKMIAKNHRINNEFYLAPAYNELIVEGHVVVEVLVSAMYGLGTPEDLRAYENAHRS